MSSSPLILILQGPNMNRLGKRPHQHYGTATLADLESLIDDHAKGAGADVAHVQSNTEGTLVDWLQERQEGAHGAIINPAGLTFYGDSLRQALAESLLPVAVVHMSNIYARDDIVLKPWRQHDVFADIATVYIAGMGAGGYLAALDHLLALPSHR
jgi:3-dehydroquinate dehydratase-2